jgi:hypothetical protein
MRHLGGVAARTVAAVGLLAATALIVPPPAGAQVTGGCSATVDSQDVGAAHNARSAITVNESDTVTVTGTAPGPITGYRIYLKFGPERFQVAEGTVGSGETTYTRTINMKDYARYGVGLYRLEGDTTGTTCTGWAYVKVKGPFPLFTAAGVFGGILAALGLAGMALARPAKPPMRVQPPNAEVKP